MNVPLVAVRRSGSPFPVVLKAALELSEESEMVPDVKVDVQHVSLKEISVVVLGTFAPVGVRVPLIALANLAAQAQIDAAVPIEGDELHRVEEVRPLRGIPQVTVILFEAE
jgi:hypothetical protein